MKPVEKAWAFTLDGHVFYVLNDVADGASLLFDATTGQWCKWFTAELPIWNVRRGIMWKGRAIGADDEAGIVWEVDATSEFDAEEHLIARAVSGFQSIRGKETFRQGSFRLTASVGFPAEEGAAIALRFSDDEGVTWSNPRTVELIEGATFQTVQFRSLGRMRAPGRLWELRDTGGLVRIEGVHSTMEVSR